METIRKQDGQIKLFSQILDKVQPCLRRDCNYANIDRIKSESIWDEDLQKWRLPDLVVARTKLPPPGGMHPGGREVALSNFYRPNSSVNDINNISTEENETSLSPEDRLFQKLEKGSKEDIVANYFRPKRRDQLLNNVNKVKLSEYNKLMAFM